MKLLLVLVFMLSAYSISYTMDVALESGATQQQLLKESN